MNGILGRVFATACVVATIVATVPDGWKSVTTAICFGLAAIAFAVTGLADVIEKAMKK